MDKYFSRQFTKCPVCALRDDLSKILHKPELKLGTGSDRFLEQLGKELKARGLAGEKFNFHLEVKQGPVLDPTKEAAIPIGSEVPGYGLMTDICMDCGCVYAIDITRSDVKKSTAPGSTMPPRRRDAKGEGLPFSLS